MKRYYTFRWWLAAVACWLGAAGTAAAATYSGVTSNKYNPAISLILNGKFASFSQPPEDYALPGFPLAEETGPGEEGFSLSESELTISGNIDDLFFGSATAALTPENEVEVEEAFFETLGLGYGLTVRAGRFYSGVGYLNSFHAHAWDFVDQPLAYRALLGNQYGDDGIQLRWVAPSDLFIELSGEWFRGESFPAGGAADDGKGTATAALRFGGDVGASHSWRAGVSYLEAKADARETEGAAGADEFTGRSRMAILDVVWKWAPDGNPARRNLKLQAEVFLNRIDGEFTPAGSAAAPLDSDQTGWYLQGVYQFMPRWRAALRYDRLAADDPGTAFSGTTLDTADHDPDRISAMVDWSHSEFSRVRLQYNRDRSRPESDNQWYLQYIMSIGAHGAHKY